MIILATILSIATFIFGIILIYHWRKFAMNKTVTLITLVAFFIGIIPILILLFASAVAISKTI